MGESYPARKVVLRLERNTRGRDLVCGDIHGCFDELEQGLGDLGFDSAKDRLFCVGDLIDRGPRSQDALAYYQQDWLYTVQGNHEHLFSTLYKQYGKLYGRFNFGNGSGWTRKQSPGYLANLWEAVHNLPLIIKVDDTLILHARLPEVDTLEAIEADPAPYENTILWERKGLPREITIPGIKRVYCGHTIVYEPLAYKGTTNIDTGAFLTYYKGICGKLTIIDLWGDSP